MNIVQYCIRIGEHQFCDEMTKCPDHSERLSRIALLVESSKEIEENQGDHCMDVVRAPETDLDNKSDSICMLG